MKRIWWIIIGSTLVVILLPLAMDWFIIGNNFPSNISNSDWVGFLGGYLGSIMGCIISLVGILWTINFTREQNRVDRELQIRPVFDIRYSDGYDLLQINEWLGYGFLHIEDQEKSIPNHSGSGILTIRNIGNGPATNISFSLSVENNENEYRKCQCGFSDHDEDKTVTANSISPGSEASLGLQITNTHKNVSRNELSRTAGSLREPVEWYVDSTRHPIPDGLKFTLTISFSDMLLNSYSQTLTFEADYYCTEAHPLEGAFFLCEITLKDKGTVIMRRR